MKENYFEEIVEEYTKLAKELMLRECVTAEELDEQDHYTLWNEALEEVRLKLVPEIMVID